MSELPIVVNLLNEGYDPRSVKEMDELMVSAADLITELVAALDNATARARMNDSDGAQISVDNYHLKNGRRLLARARSKGESDERA